MQEQLPVAIPLTDQERITLQEYETYLEQHLPTFFKVGGILVTIRDEKLYRETHQTFQEYCEQRWQISRSRAYQLMDAAAIKDDLSTTCRQNDLPEPQHEAQTRALKAAPKEARADVWEQAVSRADGQQPSATQIKQSIQDVVPAEDQPAAQPRKTHPKGDDLKRVVKGFLACRHTAFDDSVDELEQLCHEEKPEVFSELLTHCHTLFWLTSPIHSLKAACQDALEDWYMLQAERRRHEHHVHTMIDPGADPPEGDQPSEEDQEEKEDTEETLTATCDFCGEEDTAVYITESAYFLSVICLQCASKAMHELLEPDNPDVMTDAHLAESKLVEEPHHFYTEDRVKICQAGLRVLTCEANYSDRIRLKEFQLFDHGESGRWITIEKFETKAALKRRFEVLRTDSTIIFDGHL